MRFVRERLEAAGHFLHPPGTDPEARKVLVVGAFLHLDADVCNSDLLQKSTDLRDNFLFARIWINLNVNRPADDIRRMPPEVLIAVASNALYGQNLVKSTSQWLLDFFGRAEKKNQRRFLHERQHRKENKSGNEERADRIGNLPAKVLDQNRRDDDADTSERVGQNVEKNTFHVSVMRNWR